MRDPVYFVHITDTHIGPTKDYERHGYQSYPCAERMVEIINNLPHQPDFVIHTGDVVTDPDGPSYQLAADLFAQLNVPIYYVTGNHDNSADIKQYLPMGPKTMLSDNPDLLSYVFTVKNERFLVVDSHAPEELDPQGFITNQQLEIVQREMHNENNPVTVFVHHPVWPLNSPWMDRNMLILNGSKFHQVLKSGRDRLRGVFHGHIHQHLQTVRGGVVYTSAASTFAQFRAWPDTEEVQPTTEPPGYNYVQILDDHILIQNHTFFRPH